MSAASVIAIDGPAGSGKSTVGRELARRLGYLYFDTGVLYRAITWLALQRSVDVCHGGVLVRLVEEETIDVQPPTVEDGRLYTVTVGGQDVTWAIREPEVDALVSVVAADAGVRLALLPVQREIASRGNVVIIGRDIGTVVAPDAELKAYLDASLEVRAVRRHKEQVARGRMSIGLPQVCEDLRRRDEIDSGRTAAPLSVAPDAIVINTDRLSIEQGVEILLKLAHECNGGA